MTYPGTAPRRRQPRHGPGGEGNRHRDIVTGRALPRRRLHEPDVAGIVELHFDRGEGRREEVSRFGSACQRTVERQRAQPAGVLCGLAPARQPRDNRPPAASTEVARDELRRPRPGELQQLAGGLDAAPFGNPQPVRTATKMRVDLRPQGQAAAPGPALPTPHASRRHQRSRSSSAPAAPSTSPAAEPEHLFAQQLAFVQSGVDSEIVWAPLHGRGPRHRGLAVHRPAPPQLRGESLPPRSRMRRRAGPLTRRRQARPDRQPSPRLTRVSTPNPPTPPTCKTRVAASACDGWRPLPPRADECHPGRYCGPLAQLVEQQTLNRFGPQLKSLKTLVLLA